jgi:hypothetical protein
VRAVLQEADELVAPLSQPVVVVDREPGRYLGHPTTCLLGDGRTLLVAYPEGHGKGAIRLRRSCDGGQTWSGLLPVPASFATSLETPTLFRVPQAPSGRRILLFSGLYPIRMARSEDDGASWSELEPIGDFGGIVAMSSVVALASGELLALFHDDGRFRTAGGEAGTFEVLATRSRDLGLTWSAPEVVVRTADLDLCEPGALRSPDGRTLALLLRENARRAGSQLLLSEDEGTTWKTPLQLGPALTGDRHVVRALRDGRLAVSMRDVAQGSPTQGSWVLWVGTWEQLLAGGAGGARLLLLENHHAWDCGYAGLEVLADGTLVTTSYGHWIEGQPAFVACVRITPGELEGLR